MHRILPLCNNLFKKVFSYILLLVIFTVMENNFMYSFTYILIYMCDFSFAYIRISEHFDIYYQILAFQIATRAYDRARRKAHYYSDTVFHY